MSANPFIISIKAYLDSAGVKAGTKEAEQLLSELSREAAQTQSRVLRQINASTGLASPARTYREASADIEAYGKQLDQVRAKYNPVFAALQQYRQEKDAIRQAERTGALAADEAAAAISRERQAALASIAAFKGRETAAINMNRAIRASRFQTQNLRYQLVDIAQGIPLAFQSPTYALLNFANQGAQIAQAYGPEQGGAARGLKEAGLMAANFLAKFAKIGTVVGLGLIALQGFTSEIDKSTKKSVNMADVVVAAWQVSTKALYNAYIVPVKKQFSDLWDAIWKGAVWITKTLLNSLVVTVLSAGLAVEYAGKSMWITLKAIAANIQNFFVDALQHLTDFIVGGINTLIDKLNDLIKRIGGDKAASMLGLPSEVETIKGPDLSKLKAKYSDFGKEIGQLNKVYGAAFDKAFTEDHAGKYADLITTQALRNLNKPTKDELKAAAQLKAAYDKIIGSVKERIAGLQLEAQTMGLSTLEANKLAYAQDLINQTTSAGIALTPAKLKELRAYAGQLADAEEHLRKLQEAYDLGKQTTEGFFSDLKSNLSEGASLWDAFVNAVTNAFNRIADKAIETFSDTTWNWIWNLFNGGGGNGFGGLGNGLGAGASFSGLQSFVSSAKGNVFATPGLGAYSNRIVDRPTFFRFARGGVGQFGEAGPEAIMPLTRDSNGVLGVRAANANAANQNAYRAIKVELVNQSGTQLEASDAQFTRGSNGTDVLRVVVGAVNQGIAQGRFDGTLKQAFGLNRRGV